MHSEEYINKELDIDLNILTNKYLNQFYILTPNINFLENLIVNNKMVKSFCGINKINNNCLQIIPFDANFKLTSNMFLSSLDSRLKSQILNNSGFNFSIVQYLNGITITWLPLFTEIKEKIIKEIKISSNHIILELQNIRQKIKKTFDIKNKDLNKRLNNHLDKLFNKKKIELEKKIQIEIDRLIKII